MEAIIVSIRSNVENKFEPLMYTIPESYMNAKTGALVISKDNDNTFFNKIGAITDHRNLIIDYDKILQNLRFESYLIGDMGRTFSLRGQIETRRENILRIKKQISYAD
jgi:hypothetical protein